MSEKRKIYAGLDHQGQTALFYVEDGKTRRVSREEWVHLEDALGVELGDMIMVELVPGPRKKFEMLGDLIRRLQAVLASEGELPVTVWDSDHSGWYDDPERICLDVVDNTDGMGDLIQEKIPFSRFLGIR